MHSNLRNVPMTNVFGQSKTHHFLRGLFETMWTMPSKWYKKIIHRSRHQNSTNSTHSQSPPSTHLYVPFIYVAIIYVLITLLCNQNMLHASLLNFDDLFKCILNLMGFSVVVNIWANHISPNAVGRYCFCFAIEMVAMRILGELVR